MKTKNDYLKLIAEDMGLKDAYIGLTGVFYFVGGEDSCKEFTPRTNTDQAQMIQEHYRIGVNPLLFGEWQAQYGLKTDEIAIETAKEINDAIVNCAIEVVKDK